MRPWPGGCAVWVIRGSAAATGSSAGGSRTPSRARRPQRRQRPKSANGEKSSPSVAGLAAAACVTRSPPCQVRIVPRTATPGGPLQPPTPRPSRRPRTASGRGRGLRFLFSGAGGAAKTCFRASGGAPTPGPGARDQCHPLYRFISGFLHQKSAPKGQFNIFAAYKR